MPEPEQSSSPSAGITVRSVAVLLLVTLLSAVVSALAGVFDAGNPLLGSEGLAVPALLALLPLLAVFGVLRLFLRVRLLSRAEWVCVAFGVLIATPLMTVGFWRYQLSGLSTIVRLSDWTKFEALPEGFWPHGKNLLPTALKLAPGVEFAQTGEATAQAADGRAQLSNQSPEARSSLRIRVRLGAAGEPAGSSRAAVAVPGRPYLLAALVHASELGPNSSYFVRLYPDDAANFDSEPISGRREASATALLPDGALRVGAYPLTLPATAQRSVLIEFGLIGRGKVEWRDLRLYDVSAIEWAYKGFRRVTGAEYERLSLAERQGVLVVPDSPWSLAGLRYLFGFAYPIGDWSGPVLRFALFTLLIFTATLGFALLYRKQWLESERFPIPTARPVLVFLGAEESEGGLGQRYYRHPWLWIGFGITFVWCVAKVMYGYFPSLPDLRFNIGMKSYLSDAFWGRTWDNVEFQVLGLFLGFGLLMELNVLLSLVLGFLAFRLQYWFGQSQGLSAEQDFPFFQQQMLGAYWAYAVLLLFATRRYLAASVRTALSAGATRPEAREQRRGLVLFGAAIAGLAVWGAWSGLPTIGVVVLSAHVLMVALIGQKLRAECGLPYAGFNHPLGASGNYNAPLEAMLWVPLLGGMAVFGGSSVLTMSLVTAVVLPFGFLLVPGLQVELLEVGRRLRVKSGHLIATALIGVVAAIGIGGWVYFTSVYGFGAARLPGVSDFSDRVGAFRAFNSEYAALQSSLQAAAAGQAAPPSAALSGGRVIALGFGAFGATAATLLRQWFPGFGFHPVGFLVGPSSLMQAAWGSLLVAYLLRLGVLRLGGAATVREKLVPAAIGVLLAVLAAHALHIVLNAYWFFFSKGNVKFGGLL